jgi:hypothetical protein
MVDADLQARLERRRCREVIRRLSQKNQSGSPWQVGVTCIISALNGHQP